MAFEQTDLLALDTHTYDPEPLYRWLRDEEPLYWDPINELWAVSRHEDVIYVSKNTELFCSGEGVIPKVGLDTWPDEAMINLDGSSHTRQRGLVGKSFTPGRINKLQAKIEEIADSLIDSFEKTGSADLVQHLARPLPFQVISALLGYPEESSSDVLDWTDVYTHAGCGPEHITGEVIEAFENFMNFHQDLVEEKKARPDDKLLCGWMTTELDGHKLNEEKILFEHNLLLVGGSETTRSAISGGMKALLEHPEQKQWLIENLDDDEVLSRAVEEMIRWSCPFVRMRRTATEDIELHGKVIQKGQEVLMLYPAANRDPSAFQNPDVFDIKRVSEAPSLSFGYGKHFCLGASLAKLETKITVRKILRRLPNLELATQPAVHLESSFVRSLKSLPIQFESCPA